MAKQIPEVCRFDVNDMALQYAHTATPVAMQCIICSIVAPVLKADKIESIQHLSNTLHKWVSYGTLIYIVQLQTNLLIAA